jgi:hypothetical protein
VPAQNEVDDALGEKGWTWASTWRNVAFVSCSSAVETVRRLIDPRPIDNVVVVLLAGVIGFAGNELVAVYRIRGQPDRVGRAGRGRLARPDRGFTSLAVVVGASGVLAGFPLADPIVGLVITVAILVMLKSAATDIAAPSCTSDRVLGRADHARTSRHSSVTSSQVSPG